jgi:hypothetical protein
MLKTLKIENLLLIKNFAEQKQQAKPSFNQAREQKSYKTL